MILRPYDPKKDKDAVVDVWNDCNWIDRTEESDLGEIDLWFECGKAYVAELDGRPECIVTIHEGTLRHGENDVPLAGVTGVATSFVGRKEGLAARLTSYATAENSALPVAGLGFFEQGFYNRFGFGTGPYERTIRFDPANIKVGVRACRPVRITADDWQEVHESRLRTPLRHGGQTVTPAGFTRMRMKRAKKGFGLGYRGEDGRITHHAWFWRREGHHGPLNVAWVSYETPEQFMEIMAMFKRMGDQVRTVVLREPPGFQLQDVMRHPFRDYVARKDSKHEFLIDAAAHWQVRINDPVACIAATSLRCEPVRFNLDLTDPIEEFLGEHEWRGCGGKYVITLGRQSSAVKGTEPGVATLTASVSAFTRLWLGVLPATTLAVTDEISGPAELLARLDQALVLPEPRTAWSY